MKIISICSGIDDGCGFLYALTDEGRLYEREIGSRASERYAWIPVALDLEANGKSEESEGDEA